MDETHTAHVGGQLVDLGEMVSRLQTQSALAALGCAQIEELEFVSVRGRELWLFDIDPAHPVVPGLQESGQVMADEATGATDESCFHGVTPFQLNSFSAVLWKSHSLSSSVKNGMWVRTSSTALA